MKPSRKLLGSLAVPYALEDVKAVVDAADPDRLDFFRANSIEAVAERLGCDYDSAEAFVLEKLCGLTEQHFVERSDTPPPPADIYKIETTDGIHRPQTTQWFVKFKIFGPTKFRGTKLQVCSFHPCQYR